MSSAVGSRGDLQLNPGSQTVAVTIWDLTLLSQEIPQMTGVKFSGFYLFFERGPSFTAEIPGLDRQWRGWPLWFRAVSRGLALPGSLLTCLLT